MKGNSALLDTKKKNWIVRHFERYRKRRPWSFCWHISIEGFAASFLVAGVLFFLLDLPELDLEMTAIEFLLLAVILAPVVETLIFQALPICIARMCHASFAAQVVISMLLFSLPHFAEQADFGISAGLVGGFYFAFTYAHWRQKSRWTALWITIVSHSFNNGLAFILLLMLGEF